MAQNLFDLTGNVALVTGGNSGLGLAFANGLAKAGADVVIWGRRAARNAAAVTQLLAFGGRVSAKTVDVTDEAAVVDGIASAVAEMGRVDTLVLNAGFVSAAPLIHMQAKTYHELLDVNLHGVFYTLREGAKHMVARAEQGDPGGSIIFCGSLAIFGGVPGLAHYNVSKGGINSLCKNAAVELGPYGVRCNTIAPGLIDTGFGTDNPETLNAAAQAAQSAPLGRVGLPADLEGIAVYLASALSKYHTGDTITLDGGQRATVI